MTVKLPIGAAFFPKNVKLWGWTQTLLLTESAHVAYAVLHEGGFSSRHYHDKLWNRFYVVQGTLQVLVYRNNKVEWVELGAGQALDIEPGVEHRMLAVTNCELIEAYWTEYDVDVDPEDIVRKDNGGNVSETQRDIFSP